MTLADQVAAATTQAELTAIAERLQSENALDDPATYLLIGRRNQLRAEAQK